MSDLMLVRPENGILVSLDANSCRERSEARSFRRLTIAASAGLPIAADLDSSLRLLQVESLAISVFAPGETFGNLKRRVQGRFRFDGLDYRLWVTDPVYERNYLMKENGDYELGECFLTVSLGEASDDGFCYKLLAAIIERELEG